MARHLSEGGTWDDPMGSHIKNMCTEMKKLKEFVKTGSKTINENTVGIIENVKDRITTIALEAKRLQGPLSYRRIAEKFVADEPLSEESLGHEISRLQEMFADVPSEVLESVAHITFIESTVDEDLEEQHIEEEDTIEEDEYISSLDEFIAWTENFSLTEEDDEDGDIELAQDIVSDPGYSNDIKDDPKLLNKYAKK
jgi:hypothetical protein